MVDNQQQERQMEASERSGHVYVVPGSSPKLSLSSTGFLANLSFPKMTFLGERRNGLRVVRDGPMIAQKGQVTNFRSGDV